MSSVTELVERLYDRFNARDIDAALSLMQADVVWANGLAGGHVHGRDNVRRYWTDQWAAMESRARPTRFSIAADGTVHVEVHLTATDRAGKPLFDATAHHVFTIDGGLVRRFDIA